jgi:hypothetical protein
MAFDYLGKSGFVHYFFLSNEACLKFPFLLLPPNQQTLTIWEARLLCSLLYFCGLNLQNCKENAYFTHLKWTFTYK